MANYRGNRRYWKTLSLSLSLPLSLSPPSLSLSLSCSRVHKHTHMRACALASMRVHKHTHMCACLQVRARTHTDGCHFHPSPSQFHLVLFHIFLLLDAEGYTTFMLLSGPLPPSDKMSLLSISWNSSLSISELLEEMLVQVSYKYSKSQILCSCIFSLPQFYELPCGPD